MIKNLTPHDVTIIFNDGSTRVIPSSGVARAAQTSVDVAIVDGITICKMVFGDPVDLPDPAADVHLIVSVITANAAKAAGRITDDLLITADPVRDDDGKIIGCKRLARI